METKPAIFSAINAIMDDIGFIGKNGTNKNQGYNFRSIDEVMTRLQPLLVKHHVFPIPHLKSITREEREKTKYSVIEMEYQFTSATDGSTITTITVGEGMDSGDKASSKAMAAAYKYAICQLFCIPTDELAKDDPDLYGGEPDGGEKHICSMIGRADSLSELKIIWDSLTTEQKNNGIIFAAKEARKQKLIYGK